MGTPDRSIVCFNENVNFFIFGTVLGLVLGFGTRGMLGWVFSVNIHAYGCTHVHVHSRIRSGQ